MNVTAFGTFIAKGVMTVETGLNLIAVAIILIAIFMIPNENENASRDRSEIALIFAGILAILELLSGPVGIMLIAFISLWAVVENIR